jgi:hypothetical protein
MAAITLAEAEEELAYWKAESRKHSYSISGRSINRDQKHAIDMVKFWNAQVQRLTSGGITVRAATPV